MNWKRNHYKHYSAEHTYKPDKAQLVAECLIQREKLPKRVRSKQHPRQRT